MFCEHFFVSWAFYPVDIFSRLCWWDCVFLVLARFTCNYSCNMQSRAMHHISKAFTVACSKLEKIGNGMILVPYLIFTLLFCLPASHILMVKVSHRHGGIWFLVKELDVLNCIAAKILFVSLARYSRGTINWSNSSWCAIVYQLNQTFVGAITHRKICNRFIMCKRLY